MSLVPKLRKFHRVPQTVASEAAQTSCGKASGTVLRSMLAAVLLIATNTPVSADSDSRGIFPITLDVNVAANPDEGATDRASVGVAASQIDFAFLSSSISLPLAQDVLCQSFGTPSGPTLELIDTNGIATQLGGTGPLVFHPFDGPFAPNSIVLNTTPDLVCVGLTSTNKTSASFDSPCPLIPVPPPIFYGGFGDDRVDPPPQLAPGVDLQVNVELDQNPTLPSPFGSDEPGIYRVQVRNCGSLNASTVGVRDFWRPQDPASAARFEPASGWSCPGCIGGNGSGAGYIEAQGEALESLEVIEFTATRQLDSAGSSVLEDEVIELTVAAFGGPGDAPEFEAADNVLTFPISVLESNESASTVVSTVGEATITVEPRDSGVTDRGADDPSEALPHRVRVE